LDQGAFPTDLSQHLAMTDEAITAALLEAAINQDGRGHLNARRIVRREHFKRLYERNPNDVKINPEAGRAVFNALSAKFGAERFRNDRYHQESGAPDFPVRMHDGQVVSSLAISETLHKVPVVSVDYVFADRLIESEAGRWLNAHRDEIIRPQEEGKNNG
jgi:uncharacterized protein